VHSVKQGDDLELALQMMLWCGFRHMPVVDEGGGLVGILSQRDILARKAKAADAAVAGHGTRSQKVRDAMSVPVETCSPDDDVADIGMRMSALKIGCLPVLDGGKVAGIVTSTDLLAQFAMGEFVRNASRAPTVGAVMTSDPVSVGVEDDLQEAVTLLLEQAIRHLPVVDANRRVVGMVSDRDVRSAIGDPLTGLKRWKFEDASVSTIMTPDPVTIRADASLSTAISWLVDERIGALPVVDAEERLVGIVSYLDVLRFLRGAALWREERVP
jgi:CBS domain-containing protein